MIDWDRLSIGNCKRCGAASSLLDRLCFSCRPTPDRENDVHQTVLMLRVEQSMVNASVPGTKLTEQQMVFVKGAIAALSQNATFPYDVKLAIKWLRESLDAPAPPSRQAAEVDQMVRANDEANKLKAAGVEFLAPAQPPAHLAPTASGANCPECGQLLQPMHPIPYTPDHDLVWCPACKWAGHTAPTPVQPPACVDSAGQCSECGREYDDIANCPCPSDDCPGNDWSPRGEHTTRETEVRTDERVGLF